MLFLLMILLPPWNHDYYYVFAVVPLSIVLLTAWTRPGRTPAIATAVAAYVMMSPPVPYGLVDRTGWFDMRFEYLWNFADAPVGGALLLLGLISYQWLWQTPSAACSASTTFSASPVARPG